MPSNFFKNLYLSSSVEAIRLAEERSRFAGVLSNVFQHTNAGLFIVDMQRYYCDPALSGNQQTQNIAPPIRSLKAAFKSHGLPVFVIYMDKRERGVEHANGGLFGIDLDQSDILIGKDADSAFMSYREEISSVVRNLRLDTVFVAGVHFSLCVQATIKDAIRVANLEPFVVADCVANGQTRGCVSALETINALGRQNVQFVQSDGVVDAIAQDRSAEIVLAA